MNPLDSLGINGWSLLLHLVNIFSLVIVLTFVLYKPLLGFMETRRQHIVDSLEGVEVMKQEFNMKLDLMQQEKAELLASFHEQMAQGKKDLEEQRQRILAEAEHTKERLISEATAEIDRKKAALVAEVQADVLRSMHKIVLHVLKNQVDEAAVQKSITDQWTRHIAHHS